jgi:hypothetical protein
MNDNERLELEAVARHMGTPKAKLSAVEHAEGGPPRIVKAVSCSVKGVRTREEALMIAARSINHAQSDFIDELGLTAQWVDYFAKRWAPVGVANDPTNLNANFPRNVKAALGLA